MWKRTTPWSVRLALAGALCLSACGGFGSSKGEEEGPLTGGKEDSFIKPTNAGELRFGLEKELTFDNSRHYYELTFALSGRAKIAISTAVITSNLDTVLYLYQRAPGATDWGKYIQKDDDFEAGSLASQVALEEAEAGEYRIVVKAFKLAMRGDIAVMGECSGSGCPKAEQDQCKPSQFTRKLPPETGYGPSCAVALARLLPNEVKAINDSAVTMAQRCQLSAIESKAIELYYDHWNGMMGWDDFTGNNDDAKLEVQHGALEGYQVSGDIVTVSLQGGDETGVTFVFDDDGKLVSLLTIEQSPWITWFCAKPGESVLDEPDTDCFSDALRYLPRDPNQVSGDSGSIKVKDIADADEVPFFVRQLVDRYDQMFNLDDNEVVSFTYEEAVGWEGTGAGIRVELQVWERSPVTYLLVSEGSKLTLITEEIDSLPSRFACLPPV